MQTTNASPAPTLNERPNLPIVQWGGKLLVDARVLHQRLQSETRFSDWIKRRVEDYSLQENDDYIVENNYTQKSEKLKAGRKPTNYLLTLDTAKELAMLERNEIGRMIRRYFIQKEKESRGEVLALPKDNRVFAQLKTLNINGRTLYPFS